MSKKFKKLEDVPEVPLPDIEDQLRKDLHKIGFLKPREPKIVLEVLSKRQTKWVLYLTWIGFFTSLVLELLEDRIFYSSQSIPLFDFKSNTIVKGVQTSFERTSNGTGPSYSFTALLDAQVLDRLHGMVLLDMLLEPANTWQYGGKDTVLFDATLKACVESKGCQQPTQYQNVLDVTNALISMDEVKTTSKVRIFSLFQNQESFLITGTLTGYSIAVHFHGDQASADALLNIAKNFQFGFQTAKQSGVRGMQIGGLVGLILLVGFGMRWLWVLLKDDLNVLAWLPERKWLMFFWVGVFSMANPVFVFSYFGTPTPAHGLAATVIENFGASVVSYVILLFADPASPRLTAGQLHKMAFYLIKAIPCLLRFIPLLLVSLLVYPSVSGVHNSPVLATQNWSSEIVHQYVTCSMVFFASLVLWLCMVVYYVWRTGKFLLKKDYMETRHQQLAFSFFFFQFALYGIIIFIKFSTVAHLVQTQSQSFDRLVSTLCSPQSVYSRLVYLVVLLMVEMYMYLPPEKAHIIRPGQELKLLLLDDQKIPESSLKGAEQDPPTTSTEFFVAESGLKFCELADEVYFEPGYVKSKSATYSRPFNPQRVGFRFLDWIYKPEEEVNCMVGRDAQTNAIICVFRGTASMTNWGTNLKTYPLLFDTKTMCLKGETVPESISSDDDIQSLEEELFTSRGSASCENSTKTSQNTQVKRKRFSRFEINLPRLPRFEEMNARTTAQQAVKAMENVVDMGVDRIDEAGAKTVELVIRARVHGGFWGAYKLAREDVHKSIRKAFVESPCSKIIVVGHSLGGAMATCAAMDIVTHTIPKLNEHVERRTETLGEQNSKVSLDSYTYGSPRVGNLVFANEYNKLVPRTFRIQNEGDSVPHVPASWWGFHHVGYDIVINHNSIGKILLNPSFVEDWFGRDNSLGVDPHMMHAYEKALLGLLSEKFTSKECSDLMTRMYKSTRPDGFVDSSLPVKRENKSTMTEEKYFAPAKGFLGNLVQR